MGDTLKIPTVPVVVGDTQIGTMEVRLGGMLVGEIRIESDLSGEELERTTLRFQIQTETKDREDNGN